MELCQRLEEQKDYINQLQIQIKQVEEANFEIKQYLIDFKEEIAVRQQRVFNFFFGCIKHHGKGLFKIIKDRLAKNNILVNVREYIRKGLPFHQRRQEIGKQISALLILSSDTKAIENMEDLLKAFEKEDQNHNPYTITPDSKLFNDSWISSHNLANKLTENVLESNSFFLDWLSPTEEQELSFSFKF